uniref:Par3/HAL N-terminal domain-containing protein n=1 Tax=Oreochromis niloticus TaxID=8128 RepID=A0A669EZJ2_ORENI
MKVTVTFGDTSVVVPCKAGWTVRDLIEQATRRYRRILEQVSAVFALLHAILHEHRANMTQRFIPVIPRIL